MGSREVTSIVIAGVGGQGVIKASDIVADAAFRSGLDVKKSEVHGMSQRGGSVISDVRFGRRVLSPMVSAGEADYLILLVADQAENNRHLLAPDGVLIAPDWVAASALPSGRTINTALVGALSHFLELDEKQWMSAITANLPERHHEANRTAFLLGRQAAAARGAQTALVQGAP